MKARIILLWSLMALNLLTASAIAGQDNRNPSMPLRDAGNGGITGRVMLPSGMANSSHLKILLSNTQSPMSTLYSDKNGEFSFSNLFAGTYYVQVFADESVYEPLVQKVRLNPGEPAYLVLHLKEKNTPVAKTSRGNVVSTADARQTVPAAAKKAFDNAGKLIDKGDLESAITELNKALASYPDYISARNKLGVQYLKSRRLTEAAEQFKILLEKNPKYYNARLNLGIVLVEQKRHSEAIEQLSQAVALDSSQPAAHLFWGIAALDTDDLVVAERELVKALLLGGEQYSNAHYYFAHVYLKTGRREEACRELTLFLKTAPAGEMAAQARSLLQQLSGKQ
jgi:tetratricopeptide (TPR) repeat protein